MAMVQREISKTLLKQLQGTFPNSIPVLEHFFMCMEIPRPSSALDGIIGALRKFAKSRSLEIRQDKVGNVVVRKQASPGLENIPGVVIQCHLDMVCSKIDSSNHDFSTDPIEPVIGSDGFLRANGTTLGADNGIGIAACLALFDEDASFKHGPIECLFTVDEETTMEGAEFLDPNLLKGSMLINIDSEEENSICIGCAGGFENRIVFPLDIIPSVDNQSQVFVNVKIFGFSGGHTGIDIHRGIPNAIQELTNTLSLTISQTGVPTSLVKFGGGNAVNAIPRSAECQVCIPVSMLDEFTSKLTWIFSQEHPSAHIDIVPAPFDPHAVVSSPSSTLEALSFLGSIPHGVLTRSEKDDIINSSVSLSLAKLSSCQLEAHLFCRSDSDELMQMHEQSFCALSTKYGCSISARENYFPGWTPDSESALLEVAVKSHKELFQFAPKTYSVHAGLECGFILKNYPNINCISIGPRINNAHSPDEELELKTVYPFYSWLKHIISSLAHQ